MDDMNDFGPQEEILSLEEEANLPIEEVIRRMKARAEAAGDDDDEDEEEEFESGEEGEEEDEEDEEEDEEDEEEEENDEDEDEVRRREPLRATRSRCRIPDLSRPLS